MERREREKAKEMVSNCICDPSCVRVVLCEPLNAPSQVHTAHSTQPVYVRVARSHEIYLSSTVAMPSTCQEVRRGLPIKSAVRMSSVEIPDTNEKSSASPSPCPSPVSPVFLFLLLFKGSTFSKSYYTVPVHNDLQLNLSDLRERERGNKL